MSKGQATRQAIVARGLEVAAVNGLEGLTIGRLAEELSLSKSGLFANFGSKEALQVAVIEEAARQFVQDVNSKQLAAGDAVHGLLSGQNIPLHQVMVATEEAGGQQLAAVLRDLAGLSGGRT